MRLYFICGSGKVIQISSTSFLPKASSMSSIWVLKNATLGISSSMAVFAPLQNLAPLISIPTKFLSGYFFANPRVYSPRPQPNSKTKGWSFLKTLSFHCPLISKSPSTNSSRVGWYTFEKVSFSLNLLSLFLLPTFYCFWFLLYQVFCLWPE